MDFQKLITRFRQFGGMKLVWEYAKLGVLWTGIKSFFSCLVKGKSFKMIYPAILGKIEPLLENKYISLMRAKKEELGAESLDHIRSRVIWFCWLQGLDDAPKIVKACYNSLNQLSGYILRLIDFNNWREYVSLPDYVAQKWEKGRIPPANFSDLLRLALLIKFGGTWIDSTVLFTGFNENHRSAMPLGSSKIDNANYLDTDLFLFQYSPRGTTEGISISNWFITSCTNNEVLMVLRDMLYAYWKDYDCTLDYYMFHLFFSMIAKDYPEEIAKMPYGYSPNSLLLLHHLDEKFDHKKWDKLTRQVFFHKLAFRVSDKVKGDKGNYYNHILTKYGCV